MLTCAVGIFLGFLSAAAQAEGTSWAIVGASVIDGTGQPPIHDALIVGRGDRIVCVGTPQSCAIPEGATVVAARGKWIVPGLIDTHVHLFQSAGPGTAGAQQRRLAFGVTTARDAGTPGQLQANLARRGQAESPSVAEPRLSVSALVSDDGGRPLSGTALAADARRMRDQGAEAIKIKGQFTQDQLQAIAAGAGDLPVFGHTWDDHGSFLDAALIAGVDGFSHLDTFSQYGERKPSNRPSAPDGIDLWVWTKELWLYQDDARLADVVERIAAANVWVEPMLVSEKHFTLPYPVPDELAFLEGARTIKQLIRPWVPFGDYGPGAMARRRQRIGAAYAEMCRFVRRLHQRGISLVAGTDNVQPGNGLLDEISLLTECGLPPMDALRAATAHAATALARTDIGTLEEGKLADLVLLEASPLDDPGNYRRIWRVVKGGHLYDPAELLAPWTNQYRRETTNAWMIRALVTAGAVAALLTLRRVRFRRRRRTSAASIRTHRGLKGRP